MQGKSTPCAFRHKRRDLATVAHGDDFTALGDEDELSWLIAILSERYEVVVKAILGPEEKDDKSVRVLNRIITWTAEDSIELEPDQ